MVLTAKRAAEICRECYVAFRNNGKGEEKCVLELLDAADTIEALVSAQSKWISVEDRLPEKPCSVLVSVHGIILKGWYEDGSFEMISGYKFNAYDSNCVVAYWIQIPQLPKE